MKLFVVLTTPYKDDSAIIQGISDDGLITFLAKGILNSKNKNISLNNVLTQADVSFVQGKYKYPILKNCTILSSPIQNKPNLDYLICISLISESINKLLLDEEKQHLYNLIKFTLDELKNENKMWGATINFLCKIIKISGYNFDIDSCCICGNKINLVDFSFFDGGLICKKCKSLKNSECFNDEQLAVLVNGFSSDNSIVEISKESSYKLLNKINEFVFDSFGIHLKSLLLLK